MPYEPLHQRGAIEDVIAAAISERQSTFSMEQALEMPSVIRARDLIVSTAAQFVPVLFTQGVAIDFGGPRIIRRPDPFTSRQEFIAQSVNGLFETGECYWRIGDRDSEGYPRFATVLVNDEVLVGWDDRRFQRTYDWRGARLVHGRDILHVAINRRPQDLHGHGPLTQALDTLGIIDAAEAYAATFFGSGGIPSTILKTAAKMTKAEAEALQDQWAEARRRGTLTGKPAVASGGVEPMFPGTDPEKSQLQQTRDYGNTVVARLAGIPAALLHVATSGASITYSNAQAALDELIKTTVLPLYLQPIEQWWSDLVPSTQAVRFTLGELQRADIVTRFGVYEQAVALGVIDAGDIARLEGFPASTPVRAQKGNEPVPKGFTSVTPPPVEVPAR